MKTIIFTLLQYFIKTGYENNFYLCRHKCPFSVSCPFIMLTFLHFTPLYPIFILNKQTPLTSIYLLKSNNIIWTNTFHVIVCSNCTCDSGAAFDISVKNLSSNNVFLISRRRKLSMVKTPLAHCLDSAGSS